MALPKQEGNFFNPTITTWHLKFVVKIVCMYHFLKKSEMDLWQWHYRNRKKNCDKLIVTKPLPKQGKKNCGKVIVAMALPKQGEKKIVKT